MEESYREQHEGEELQRGLSQRVKGQKHKFVQIFPSRHMLDLLCKSIKCNYSKINFQTLHFYLTPVSEESGSDLILPVHVRLIYMYHVVRGVISLLLPGASNPQVLTWHYFTTYSEGRSTKTRNSLHKNRKSYIL